MSPLIPRHRPSTSQPVSVKGFRLRLKLKDSTSGACLLRGYFYVHVSYDPDSCSPRLAGLCRWASEGSVSPSPCHPSYVALAFTTMGLPPVRMRYPSLGTPNFKGLTLMPFGEVEMNLKKEKMNFKKREKDFLFIRD